MTHIWVLASGFFFANFMCLIAIWNTYSFNSLDPKYVGSSYDPNKKEEMDSLLLKSVEKYIKKYINIKTTLEENVKNDLYSNSTYFLGEPLDNYTEANSLKEKIKNYESLKISESSKFSMFLDRDKENIMILKISNEDNKINKYDSKNGEVILYSIPVDNFIPNNKIKYNKNINNNNSSNEINNNNNFKKRHKENFNFLNFTQKKSYLENSLIKECWSSKFFGRIIGAVASADKKKLSIFYSVVKGHTVTYRIRYFHDISCNNELIKNSDSIMIENFNQYLDSRNDLNERKKKASNYIENYFEISDEVNNNNFDKETFENKNKDENNINFRNGNRQEKINLDKDRIFKNYFDDYTYDDFLLKGNTPITAMAIKEDVIAYARDLDFRQYYILKREKKILKNVHLENDPVNSTNTSLDENAKNINISNLNKILKEGNIDNKKLNKTNNFYIDDKKEIEKKPNSTTIWKVSSLGPKIDRKIQPFFHTNSLKFVDDSINDYRLIHIFVSLNSTDISCYGYFRISNHTDFNENFTELTFTSIPFFKVFFINEILDGNEEFNLEKSVRKLKKYLQPTLFSNNFNSQDMIFEFTKSYLLLMHSNITNGNVHFIRMRPDAREKISKIHSDMDNENIVIKYEGKKEMIYLLKEKLYIGQNFDDPNSFTEYSKSISLKNLPKFYRNREPITYLIEKIQEKYVMIMLNEDGILLGLDMTDVRNKITGKGWFGFFNNFNWSTTLILLFNIGSVIIYYHYSNVRLNQMGNIARRRQTEINNVIQEIIRINNLNLAYSANLINRNPPNEIQNIDPNENNINYNNNEINLNDNNLRNENDINSENHNIHQNNNLNENQNDIINLENQINNDISEENHSENNLNENNIREENNYEIESDEHQNLIENSNENNLNNNNETHEEDLFRGINQIDGRNFHFNLNRNLNTILSQLNSQLYRNINISDVRGNNNNNSEDTSQTINQRDNDNTLDDENIHNNINENNILNNPRNEYHLINLENNLHNRDFNSNVEIANETNFEINRVKSKDINITNDELKDFKETTKEVENESNNKNIDLNQNNLLEESINHNFDNLNKIDIREIKKEEEKEKEN